MNAGGAGGTKISVGVVFPGGEVLTAARHPTPRSPKKPVETVVLGQEVRLRARPPSLELVEITEATRGSDSGVLEGTLVRDADGAYVPGR